MPSHVHLLGSSSSAVPILAVIFYMWLTLSINKAPTPSEDLYISSNLVETRLAENIFLDLLSLLLHQFNHPTKLSMEFLTKGEEPTPTDQVEGDAAVREKDMSSELEMAQPHPQVDPEIEKRVVRKLDWRVPPIVATLCRLLLVLTE